MADSPVADGVVDTSPAEDSAQDSTNQGTDTDAEATWKKRLSGQTAATNTAIRERDELRQRLSEYEQKQRSEADSKLVEATQLREALELERKARQQDAIEHQLALLDVKYPRARTEFPDLRDEAQLAKAEALFAEPVAVPPKTPAPGVRPSRNESPDQQREETSKDIFARLKQMPWPKDDVDF